MPLAEQIAVAARGDALGERRLVEAGERAQVRGRVEIDHQHAQRTRRLGLQLEAAFELQRRAEQHGERRRFADHAADRLGIGVALENGVDARPRAAPAGRACSGSRRRRAGRCRHGRRRRRRAPRQSSVQRSQAPGEHALLRVKPVLGFVEHHRLRPVDHLVGDFLAAMGRQAMHEDRVGARRGSSARR